MTNTTNPRIVFHPHNPNKTSKTVSVLVPVDDDIYSKEFDQESLDAEPVRTGLVKVYEITSIPFVIYGINKGDLVSINRRGVVTKKVRDSGQYGYRIAYPNFSSEEEAHAHINPVLEELQKAGFETEEFNHKISAINTRGQEDAGRIELILNRLISEKKIEGFDTIR
jgi:hypothetical protein